MPPQPSKKRKGNADGQIQPQPSAVPHRDVLQRLNYLYQSASLLTSALGVPTERAGSKRDVKGKEKEKEEDAKYRGRMDIDVDERLIPTQPRPLQTELSTATAATLPSPSPSNTSMFSINPPEFEPPISAEPLHERLPPPPPIITTQAQEHTVSSALLPISRMLGRTMREVGTKSTLRIDPSIKRTLCKKCHALLIPGINCTIRVKPSGPHAHIIVRKCQKCGTGRRLPATPLLPEAGAYSLQPPSTPTLVPPLQSPSPLPNDPDPQESTPLAIPTIPPPSSISPPPVKKLSKREKKDLRRARRQPVFFERKEHVTFVGEKEVVYDL